MSSEMTECKHAAKYNGRKAPTCGCAACERIWDYARVGRKWSGKDDYETITVNFTNDTDQNMRRIAKLLNYSLAQLAEALMVAHVVKAECAKSQQIRKGKKS